MSTNRMGFNEILHWFLDKLHELRDAAMGSFVYFLYGHFYQRKDLYRGLTAFFIGTIFAIYLAPLFCAWVNWSIQVVSFLTGLLGMRLTEALVNQDFKAIIKNNFQPFKSKNNE